MIVRVLTVFLLVGFGVAESGSGSSVPIRKDIDYTGVLASCESSFGSVHFIKAFKAFWPVPSNFVLLDSRDSTLEYKDSAFPWVEPKKISTIIQTPIEDFSRDWGWITKHQKASQKQRCGLGVIEYQPSALFVGRAVTFDDGRNVVLLMGPVADAWQHAERCYELTLSAYDKSCESN